MGIDEATKNLTKLLYGIELLEWIVWVVGLVKKGKTAEEIKALTEQAMKVAKAKLEYGKRIE